MRIHPTWRSPHVYRACLGRCHVLFDYMATYKISRAGTVLGEYDEAIVRRYLDAGSITLHDYGWTVGMTEWKQLHELGFRVNAPAAPLPPQSLAPSAQAAAASGQRPFAYSAWMLAAFFAPYLFSWRIIFDKTLGYSKGWKIFYAVWIPVVLIMVGGSGSGGGNYYSGSEIQARMAHPYDVRDNQERPMAAGGVINNARNLVKGVLKAPSSARFSEYANTDWDKTYDDGITQYYVVDGWVESQNSFGAMLRSKFLICYSANDKTVTRHFLRLGSEEYGSIPVQCKPAFK